MAEIKDQAPEENGFVEEAAPEEIKDFLIANDVGDRYQILLKEKPKEGGKLAVIRTYTNNCPTIAEIGEQWGPGEYVLAISYKVPGMNGILEPKVKNLPLSLPERAWGEIHDDYLERRRRERKEKKLKELGDEADRASVFQARGIASPAQPSTSELEQLEKAINLLSKFGIDMGNRGATPKKSFGEAMLDAAPLITALTPLVLGLLKRDNGGSSNDQLLNTLVTNLLLQKPTTETESMKQMTGFLMSTMTQLFEMKEAMKPAEKESVVEKIVDKIFASGPVIANILKMTAEQRQNNWMVKNIKNSKEAKFLRDDPEALAMTISKMDAFYGTEQTNQILAVMGFARPAPVQPEPEPAPATENTEPARDDVSGPAPMAGGADGGEDEDLNFSGE